MLISSIIAQYDVSVHDALQNSDLKNTVLLLKSTWNVLPISIIEKSWSKLLNWDDREFDKEDNIPLANLEQQNEIETYRNNIEETVQLLSKLTANSVLSMDEIENWNSNLFDETDVDESDSEADNNVVQNSAAISYSDAINAANMLIKCSEQNADLTAKHMSNLLQIRSDIVKKQILKPPKQTKANSRPFYAVK